MSRDISSRCPPMNSKNAVKPRLLPVNPLDLDSTLYAARPTTRREDNRPDPGHAVTKTLSDSFSFGRTAVGTPHISIHSVALPKKKEDEKKKRKTHIRPRTTQINNLGTPIPVLLQPGTLEAVESVGDALAAAHDALVLVVAEAALVADAHQRGRPHVRVAHGALAVALVAEPPDRDAGLLAAHHEVAV